MHTQAPLPPLTADNAGDGSVAAAADVAVADIDVVAVTGGVSAAAATCDVIQTMTTTDPWE